MIFRFRGKEFKGLSWIDVVRSLERDDKEYRSCGGPIRQYLTWSLNQLRGTVGPRDIDLSDRLEDETLTLGYLLLLDEYGLALPKSPNEAPKVRRDGIQGQAKAQPLDKVE
jgi:hypothetical protein